MLIKQVAFAVFFVFAISFISVAQTDEPVPTIIRDPYDKFERPTAIELMSRLNSFYAELESDPNAEGIVVIEFNKKDTRENKIALLKMFDRAFRLRKHDPTRYTLFISESNREQTTLWILSDRELFESKDDDKRDERKVIRIKGENLRIEIKRLLKKF